MWHRFSVVLTAIFVGGLVGSPYAADLAENQPASQVDAVEVASTTVAKVDSSRQSRPGSGRRRMRG